MVPSAPPLRSSDTPSPQPVTLAEQPTVEPPLDWSEADLRLALAAEREARRRAERAADRLARLQGVTAALGAARTPERVAQVMIDLGLPAVGAVGGGVFLIGEDGTTIRPLRLVGHSQTDVGALATVPASGACPITDAMRRGEPIIFATPAERAARYPHLSDHESTSGGALVALALRIDGRTVGGLEIRLPDEGRPNDDEMAFLLALAGQGAQALERTRLQVAEREARDRLRALVAVSQAIATAGLDQAAIQETVVRQAVEVLGDTSLMRLLTADGRWLNVAAVHHPDPITKAAVSDLVTKIPYGADEGMLGRVIATGEPLFVPVLSVERLRAEAKVEYGEFLVSQGVHSLLIVPLRAHGRILGTLSLSRDTPGRPYTLDDLSWLQEIADRAALALDHARLFAEIEISEERQRLALAAVHGSVWERDLASGAIWWSPAHYALIDRDPADGPLPLEDWLRLVHPKDRARLRAARAKVTTALPLPVDYRLMRPDGGVRWLSSQVHLVHDAKGQPARMVGITLDITERKQAELALRVTEDRLRIALRHWPMIVSHADRDLRYTWVHHSDSVQPGVELLGRRDDEVLPLDQAAPIMALKRRALVEGRSLRGEVSVTEGKRRETWDLTVEPLRDEAGAVVGLTAAALNITERVAAEAAQARLAERERIAMDLHDSVLQSLYGVTLTLGAAEAILATAPADAGPRLDLAMAQLETVIREIRASILGQQTGSLEPATLEAGVRALAEELRATTAVPLSVSIEMADEPLPATTMSHLLLVAREALANARRHADARRIDVHFTRVNNQLMLTIRDDGRGFESAGTTQHTGQGLRNMRARATALGGQLTITSAVGQGTEVRLTITADETGHSHDGR